MRWKRNDELLKKLKKISDDLEAMINGSKIFKNYPDRTSANEPTSVERSFGELSAGNLDAFLKYLNTRLKSRNYLPVLKWLRTPEFIGAYVITQRYL